MDENTCSIEGCEKPVRSKGWCNGHYTKWRRWGHPDPVRQRSLPAKIPLRQRFDAGWSPSPGGCWVWRGALSAAGYGALTVDSKTRKAHRVSYELYVGPIPDGLQLDHLCHTMDAECEGGRGCLHRRCVNPEHLEPVSLAENVRRGTRANKTHCIHGHEFTPENTLTNDRGHRWCRKCAAVRRGLRTRTNS